MRFDRVFLPAFNLLARLFGVAAILAGITFLGSAYAIQANRLLDVVIGLFLIVMGIVFLVVKRLNARDLARM
jgi:uncharacterized membrane protein HdeD (DUF308 family)